MRHSIFYISLLFLCACGTPKTIVDKPITFNDERIQLTKAYLSTRYELNQDHPTIVPKMIVLHWTAIPTLEKSFSAFNPITLPSRPDLVNASDLNVSSQFLVDLDGTIYRLMPETTMARHVIGLNHTAIGVENVGGTDGVPLTKAQIKANIWLVNYLNEKYPIEYLIGHYEYSNFENHELWLEVDKGYRTQKTDPGLDFMKAVKKGTRKLNLKSAPVKTSNTI